MTKVTFFIPTSMVASPDLAEFLTAVLALAGGYTRNGIVDGVWWDDENGSVRDTLFSYSVIIQDAAATALTNLFRDFKRHTKEKKLYFELIRGVVLALY